MIIIHALSIIVAICSLAGLVYGYIGATRAFLGKN